MKIAKTLLITAIAMIMILAISCDTEIHTREDIPQVVEEEQSVNNILMNWVIPTTDPKSVSVSVDSTNSNISYFKYRFTPLWDSSYTVEGSTDGWQTTTLFPTDWEFYFEQGKWRIEIEIYDDANNKLGTTFTEEKYLNAVDKSLCSGFYEWLISTGTGSLQFLDIVIPKLYDLPYHYEMATNADSIEVKNYYVTWALMQKNSVKYSGTFSLISTDGGLATFGQTSANNIAVGNYVLALSIKEGLSSTEIVSSGGEVSDISIFRSCITNVHALVNTSDFINCTFRAQQNETGYTGKIKASYTSGSKTVTLTLVAENATNVKWYQDGVYKSGYGNGITAEVSGITSGAAGAGYVGTMSNYFDCVFTNSETGEVSSCSYILVAGGSWGGSNTDTSVFTVNTGSEITSWSYTANAIDAISDSYGEGSGIATPDAYFDERKWTIDAVAYHNGTALGHGTFIGYINKTTQFIDIPLDNTTGTGTLVIGNIVGIRNRSGSFKNRKLSWTITNLETGAITKSSYSLSGTSSSASWDMDPNLTMDIATGTYQVDLVMQCDYSASGIAAIALNGTYYGYCTVIVNVYEGITTIVQGSLSADKKS